ncbi:hypothetical protein EmuJ_000948300 [Echinococcus multilocularis]|uniref:Uncharacterized protein n=1 Tax=Echinococcus multilocularis TaxID=6211 RepID=A0A068YAG5_ECHMU|nr:hypothetical protein EmuJ_000948300 [Echinococcus multilocularis]
MQQRHLWRVDFSHVNYREEITKTSPLHQLQITLSLSLSLSLSYFPSRLDSSNSFRHSSQAVGARKLPPPGICFTVVMVFDLVVRGGGYYQYEEFVVCPKVLPVMERTVWLIVDLPEQDDGERELLNHKYVLGSVIDHVVLFGEGVGANTLTQLGNLARIESFQIGDWLLNTLVSVDVVEYRESPLTSQLATHPTQLTVKVDKLQITKDSLSWNGKVKDAHDVDDAAECTIQDYQYEKFAANPKVEPIVKREARLSVGLPRLGDGDEELPPLLTDMSKHMQGSRLLKQLADVLRPLRWDAPDNSFSQSARPTSDKSGLDPVQHSTAA